MNDQTTDRISEILLGKGASEMCYAISSNSDIDAKEMQLVDAISETVGYGSGTFISCIPGRLSYFESSETNGRYLLENND